MRPRVEELETELKRIRAEMEGAHFNELNDLQLKIAELEATIEELNAKLKRDVHDKDDLILRL